MRFVFLALFFALTTAANIQADGERPGAFDYYVLSLSWSPNWCKREGDARKSPQCAPDQNLGWTLHGLWPQYHRGWPAFCPTVEPHPSRALTLAMTDIMGSSGLAWYQWKKHGTCSGLSAAEYFALSRHAYAQVARPPIFRKLERPVKLPAKVVEDAFLKHNPEWAPDMLTITCRDEMIQEARLCLSKSLVPVPCGRDVIRDCTKSDALFMPIR